LANLRAAVQWAIATSNVDVVCRVVTPLAIEMIRIDSTVSDWAEIALTLDGVEEHPWFPQVAAFAAFGALHRGELEAARERCAWAHAVASQAEGSPARLLRVLDSEMILAMTDGVEAWAACGRDRLTLARAVGDEFELARALTSLAVAMIHNGADARPVAMEGLEVATKVGQPSVMCAALLALAQIECRTDLAKGLALFADAKRAAEQAGNASLLAVVQNLEGQYLLAGGELMSALPVLADGLEHLVRAGYLSHMLAYTRLVAAGLIELDDHETAAILAGFIGDRGFMNRGFALNDAIDALLASLPEVLGPAAWLSLSVRGAGMTTDEIVRLARDAVHRRAPRPL
jgi:hypothetical protein